MRRFIVLLACLLLTVGVAGQATAAPSQRKAAPTAPTGLAVTPLAALSATASWTAPGSSGSSRILGYTITSKAENKRYPTVALASANSRSTVLKNLAAGITYTISVTAWNSAGRSPAATLKYTVPSATSSFIFTFDTTAKSVVKIPKTGGAPVTVASGFGTNSIRFAVDKPGNAYILDTVAKSVVKVPASGPKTTLRTGLSSPFDIQLDAAGLVYVLDGSKVIRLAGTGSPEKVIGEAPTGFTANAMFVAANGTVNILVKQDIDVRVLTIPAAGAVTTRSVSAGFEGNYYLSMIGDQVGNLYLEVAANGASGYVGWNRLAAGSSTQITATTKITDYAAAVGGDNQFYLLETVSWCAGPSEYMGTCTADRTVPEIRKTPPTGATTSVPIQGLTLNPLGALDAGVAVDAAGYLYVAQSAGPSAGVLRYAPTGGAPVVLATGTFTKAAING